MHEYHGERQNLAGQADELWALGGSEVFLDPASAENTNWQLAFALKYINKTLDELAHCVLIIAFVKSIKDDHHRISPSLSGRYAGLNGHNGLK